MKGIFVGTLFVIAILLLIVGGIFFIVFSNQYINLKVSLKSSEILKDVDVVEIVKRGLEIAYRYSFLQSAYYTGNLGGYKDEISALEWRKYHCTYFPNSYLSNLEENVKYYIKEYFKNLENFIFSEPNVNIVLSYINGELSEAKMEVYFDKPLNYSKYFFSIYDNPNRTILNLPINYFKLYNESKKAFIDDDPIKRSIEDAISRMDSNCKNILVGNVCEYNLRSADEVLNERCPNAIERLKDNIRKEIQSLADSLNINIDIDTIVLKYTSESHYTLRESEDCGCKRSIKIDDEDKCIEYYKKYYNLNYNYNYFAAVKAIITFILRDDYYLIYDPYYGNVNFRNLLLKFNVTTSNDYGWRPI
jgi:hypothetical protein